MHTVFVCVKILISKWFGNALDGHNNFYEVEEEISKPPSSLKKKMEKHASVTNIFSEMAPIIFNEILLHSIPLMAGSYNAIVYAIKKH